MASFVSILTFCPNDNYKPMIVIKLKGGDKYDVER